MVSLPFPYMIWNYCLRKINTSNMESKIITINPDILKNYYQTKKTKKETTPKLPKQNKTLRKNTYSKILKHIREQQEKKYNQYLNEEKGINNEDTQNEQELTEEEKINKTIEFLDESVAIKRGKSKREMEKVLQEKNINSQSVIISNSIPTTSQYQTLQTIPQPQPQHTSQSIIQPSTYTQFNEGGGNNLFATIEQTQQPNTIEYPQFRSDKRKKTIKKTFYLGNMPRLGKVSVLIPNKTIRKKILTDKEKHNETSISQIKSFLLKNGFIKSGTTAPDYLLIDMYKNIKMIGGNVINHNIDNLLSGFSSGV